MKKPPLPELPKLTKPTLPPMAAPPTLAKPPTPEELARLAVNPLDVNDEFYDDSPEQNLAIDNLQIEEEFRAIHEARAGQEEAVRIANDTEFWCAFYFQTREQCDAFCAHFGFSTNKFIDGQEAAAKVGVALPKREHKYKVGKIDKKLADMT